MLQGPKTFLLHVYMFEAVPIFGTYHHQPKALVEATHVGGFNARYPSADVLSALEKAFYEMLKPGDCSQAFKSLL